MENKFIKAMQTEENVTYTENGMVAVKSTNDDLLNLFGSIGALRNRGKNKLDNINEVERLFSAAFAEDKLLALKTAFYARDIRSGLGEREVPKLIFKYLANTYPEIMRKNIYYIPCFGRFDDLYALVDTPVENDMWDLVRAQFNIDLDSMSHGEPTSLLAKWLKSVNTSSAESKKLGRLTASKLGLSEKVYRKALSELRSYIDVVEAKMAAGEWDKINYSQVTSLAMKNYRTAFYNRDGERFKEFIDKVTTGESKINASTLYPYNILEGYELSTWGTHISVNNDYDAVLEEQWKALPNYVDGKKNVLMMCDTSGSMSGRPLNTSVGLGIYFAERNEGVFKNKIMTFSSKPSFVTLKGEKLIEKVKSIPSIVENTNIEAAFDLVLQTSVKHNVPAEDMPVAIVIISDMEFDVATRVDYYSQGGIWTFYDEMKTRFNDAGYEIPNVVFWNVDSRQDVFHALCEYKGVQMASGQGVSVFKQILNNFGKTPYEAMLEVLNRPEYDCITI